MAKLPPGSVADCSAAAEARANYTASVLVRLAAALGVSVERLDVLDVIPVAAPGSRRLLATGTSGAVDISVVLVPDGSSSSQDSQGLVQSSLASSSNLTVLSVQQEACGICGNGICEAGERCDSGGTGCCAQDCSLALSVCPSAAGSTVPCSGSGVCLPSSGVCACYSGYLGAACNFPYFSQVTAAAQSNTSAPPIPGSATPPLRRGASVDGWLLSLPPIAGSGLSPKQLEVLSQSGFDFLRLPVGPASLYNKSTGNLLQARLANLNAAMDWVLASGLDILLDLHFVVDADKMLVLSNPEAFDTYCRFAGQLAKHLTDTRPAARVALELFNEPRASSNASAPSWPELQQVLYTKVRAAAGPGLLLLLTGDDYSSGAGLSRLQPVDDGTPVAYGFHFYGPSPFTHQGATWGWCCPTPFANADSC